MATQEAVTILVPFCFRAVDYSHTEELLRACQEIPVARVIFDYIEKGESLLDYFYRLKQIVVNNGVDVVLAVSDIATLVQSALVREFPKRLEGPSVESSFLAYHKVYTRQCLDPDSDPSFHGILDLDSPTLPEDAAAVLKRVELPAFAKVPCGDGSQGVFKVRDSSQLTDIMRTMGHIHEADFSENQHISSAPFLRAFLHRVLDVDHYPMVLRNTIILEPYIDAPAKVCVDGCVYNKEIIHWAISDSLLWPGQDIAFQGSYMPSTLPDVTQRRLWDGYDEVVGRMIDHGFNNQFVHVEYFILADGQIKLIEVNARISGNLSGLYSACLSGPPPLQALLRLCCGVRPPGPTLTGRAALNLPLQAHDNYAGKVGDMVKLSEIDAFKNDPDVKISWVMTLDEVIIPGIKSEFAKLWTYGKTPDDAKKKCREVVQRLVKKPEQLKFHFP